MKLDRVKFHNGRPYIGYIVKSGKQQGYIRKFYGEIIICENCGEECFATNSAMKIMGWGKFCSQGCASQLENNSQWKNGRAKDGNGYLLIRSPNHPYKNTIGYNREHRLVVEKQIGRYLKPKEHIHHINKIADDNRPENLMTFRSNSIHRRFEEGHLIATQDIIFDGRNFLKTGGVI